MGDAPPDWAVRALDAASDAVVTLDAEGQVVEVNQAAERTFGWPREDVVGRPAQDLFVDLDVRTAASPQTDRLVHARLRRRDGAEVPAELAVVRSSDDPPLWTALVRGKPAAPFHAAPGAVSQVERILADAEEMAQVGAWTMDLSTGETHWSEGMYRIAGIEPNGEPHQLEDILAFVHPEDRPRVADLLRMIQEDPGRVPEDGVMGELRVVRPDESVRDAQAIGAVERDASGRPTRWLGVLRDVTDQRLSERELRAHYAVSQALMEWESFDEGTVNLLSRLGTALEYPMGSMWIWDERAAALVCRAFWSAPGFDAGQFELTKRSLRFAPGQGKPGMAWQRGEPVVTRDIAVDPVFQPREAAMMHGVRSGLAFPAIGPDGPVLVLSFYAMEPRMVSPTLVRTLTVIGQEIGRFLAPRRAELGFQPLSPRELEVLKLAAEGNSGPAIAQVLVLSPATIKTHFENIYEKLGVSDRTAAVALAIRTGLIQ